MSFQKSEKELQLIFTDPYPKWRVVYRKKQKSDGNIFDLIFVLFNVEFHLHNRLDLSV